MCLVGPGAVSEELAAYEGHDGVDLSPLRAAALGRPMPVRLSHDDLRSVPVALGSWEFPVCEDREAVAEFSAVTGTVSGYATWFELELSPGVRLATGPAEAPTPWPQFVFPCAPFEMAGDDLTASWRVEHVPDGLGFTLAWSAPGLSGNARHHLAGSGVLV